MPKRQRNGADETQKNEHPLISNRKLLEIYTKLVEVRALDERGSKPPRRKNAPQHPSIRRHEAPRVSALVDLKPGDLISDASHHPATELILAPQSSRAHSSHERAKAAKQLPSISSAQDRLQLAMGAALALKTAGQGNIVVVFVAPRDLSSNSWKRILTLAGQLELPIIFVVLPGSKKTASLTSVSDKARLARIPGIPVDAADVVALFRVIQESLGRTRSADGPVLIECLAYQLPGHSAHNDPIDQMRRFLLERKVSTMAELNAIRKTSERKLRQSKR